MSFSVRGRLIRPCMAEIAQIDTLQTSLPQPDVDNTVSSGYHSNFGEPRVIPTSTNSAGSPRGAPARKETLIRCPVQWEQENFGLMQQWGDGNSPAQNVTLVFHFADLERLGLVNDDGSAKINKNDRLCAIYHIPSNKLIQRFSTERGTGMYVIEAAIDSIGLRGSFRNLLIVQLEDRETTVRIG